MASALRLSGLFVKKIIEVDPEPHSTELIVRETLILETELYREIVVTLFQLSDCLVKL